jgi:hypothetical protein
MAGKNGATAPEFLMLRPSLFFGLECCLFSYFSTFLLRDKEEKFLLEATHARKRT